MLIFFCFKLNSIAAEKNSTIVFPLPMEMLSSFMNLNTAKIKAFNDRAKGQLKETQNLENIQRVDKNET